MSDLNHVYSIKCPEGGLKLCQHLNDHKKWWAMCHEKHFEHIQSGTFFFQF